MLNLWVSDRWDPHWAPKLGVPFMVQYNIKYIYIHSSLIKGTGITPSIRFPIPITCNSHGNNPWSIHGSPWLLLQSPEEPLRHWVHYGGSASFLKAWLLLSHVYIWYHSPSFHQAVRLGLGDWIAWHSSMYPAASFDLYGTHSTAEQQGTCLSVVPSQIL